MRIELALEIKKILEQKPDAKVLEIGVGEGDLTKYIIKHNSGIVLECLDLSPEMIASAQKMISMLNRVWRQTKGISFIQDDVYNFLDKAKDNTYDIITSAWTIHNFTEKDQKRLFEKIYDKLQKDWIMLIMDKIYTDDTQENMRLLRLQNARYRYLNLEAKNAITIHEMQDYDSNYRMEESRIKLALKETWFRDIQILDRIERDVLLTAKK